MNDKDETLTTSPGRRLGGADIGVCLTRLHHDRFTPHRRVFDEIRKRDAARGLDHEHNVLQRLGELHAGIVEIGRGPRAAERTIDAMRSGAPLITGGWFESRDGISVGAPDLLVQIGDGYAAVEVKNHKVVGTNGAPAMMTPLGDITDIAGEETKFRGHRRKDLLQVAHYNRLVDESAFAATSSVGGVIGTEQPYGCLWVDLGEGNPSVMNEYQAILAASRHAISAGSEHPQSPLHEPWWHTECRTCDWASLCSSQLVARNDVTLLTMIGADLRTILAADDISRIDQVAALSVDDERLPDASVVLQARARTADQLLRRDSGDGPLEVPSARREVDFDIETYNGEIYLAGFLITIDDVSTFEPVVNWAGTPEGESQVVSEMFEKLASLSGPDTIVLHWTDYERRMLIEAGRRHGLSIDGYPSVSDWFDQHAVDLCDWTRKTLVSPNGFGLKVIAPLCGFEWRDDDPGGRQSEVWFEHVLAGDDAMKHRLLAYNEDDVAAQLEIRRWVRSRDSGIGPGSAIPSVGTWPRRQQ